MVQNSKPRHILGASDFNRDLLERLYVRANQFQVLSKTNRHVLKEILYTKRLLQFMYEPSSRTCSSFALAAMGLGADIVTNNDAQKTSSAAKGETLNDTVQMFGDEVDAYIFRVPHEGQVAQAAKYSNKSVINAGDGTGEHPTQMLVDFYTLWQLNNHCLDNLEITIVGDLKHGRTVHSLVKGLLNYNNVKITCVATENYQLPKQYVTHQIVEQTDDFEGVLPHSKFLYMTRLQHERQAVAAKVQAQYRLDNDNINYLPKDASILHPLPRLDELHTDICDKEYSSAKFFGQSSNGIPVRMALLEYVLCEK